MITMSITTLLFGILTLLTIGAKVGKWQNQRDFVEAEPIVLICTES